MHFHGAECTECCGVFGLQRDTQGWLQFETGELILDVSRRDAVLDLMAAQGPHKACGFVGPFDAIIRDGKYDSSRTLWVIGVVRPKAVPFTARAKSADARRRQCADATGRCSWHCNGSSYRLGLYDGVA